MSRVGISLSVCIVDYCTVGLLLFACRQRLHADCHPESKRMNVQRVKCLQRTLGYVNDVLNVCSLVVVYAKSTVQLKVVVGRHR